MFPLCSCVGFPAEILAWQARPAILMKIGIRHVGLPWNHCLSCRIGSHSTSHISFIKNLIHPNSDERSCLSTSIIAAICPLCLISDPTDQHNLISQYKNPWTKYPAHLPSWSRLLYVRRLKRRIGALLPLRQSMPEDDEGKGLSKKRREYWRRDIQTWISRKAPISRLHTMSCTNYESCICLTYGLVVIWN